MKDYVRVNNRPCVQKGTRYTLERKILPILGDRPVAAIGVEDIDKLKMTFLAQKLSSKTINNHLGILRRCLHSALEWEVIEKIPKIQFLKAASPPFSYLEPDKARRLVATAPKGYWRAMVILALQTGLRASEIIGLEWQDVDFERHILLVQRGVVDEYVAPPKNNRIRYVVLTNSVVSQLMALPKRSHRIFPVPKSTNSYDYIRRHLKTFTDEAGLPPVGWHALRHSFASHLASAGAPLKVIQEALGHSSYEMTLRYAHLLPSTLHQTMELLPKLTDEEIEADSIHE
jgi:integrase